LNIAVFALVILYFLHSLVFLRLPRRNPVLCAAVNLTLPPWLQKAAAGLSVAAMAGLIAVQVAQDVRTLQTSTLGRRIAERSLTSLELSLAWAALGMALYKYARRRGGGPDVPSL